MYKFEEIMARGDDDDRTVRERLAELVAAAEGALPREVLYPDPGRAVTLDDRTARAVKAIWAETADIFGAEFEDARTSKSKNPLLCRGVYVFEQRYRRCTVAATTAAAARRSPGELHGRREEGRGVALGRPGVQRCRSRRPPGPQASLLRVWTTSSRAPSPTSPRTTPEPCSNDSSGRLMRTSFNTASPTSTSWRARRRATRDGEPPEQLAGLEPAHRRVDHRDEPLPPRHAKKTKRHAVASPSSASTTSNRIRTSRTPTWPTSPRTSRMPSSGKASSPAMGSMLLAPESYGAVAAPAGHEDIGETAR